MTKLSRLCVALAAAAGLTAAVSAQAAVTIQIINGDPPNVGFNDPTPVAAVGGNAGTTLGQQRLNVYNAVAMKWGETLTSSVPIVVYATNEPLACVTLASTPRSPSWARNTTAPAPSPNSTQVRRSVQFTIVVSASAPTTSTVR